MEENKPIVVFDNTLSMVQSIFAALLYTITFAIAFYFFYFQVNGNSWMSIPDFILFFCFSLAASVKISKVTIIEIDLVEKLVIITTRIIFFEKTKAIDVLQFEYVVLHEKDFSYIITLWYNNNKHFVILSFNKKSKAYLYAKSLCKQLGVDLLDRTSGKPVWIENAEL